MQHTLAIQGLIAVFINFFMLSAVFSSPALVYNSKFQSIDLDVGTNIYPFVVDWDNDGNKDIIAGRGDTALVWYKNAGGNPPALTYMGVILYDTVHMSPVVSDWNNDGKKDIIAGGRYRKIKIYLNTGTDTNPAFAGGTTIDSSGNGQPIMGSYQHSSCSIHPWITDWNNDGKKDIVAGMGYNNSFCVVYINYGTDTNPSFDTGMTIPNITWIYRLMKPVMTDWDNDGKKDIIVSMIETSQYFRLYMNSGSDTSPSFSSYSTLTSGGYTMSSNYEMYQCVADWDNDGKKDLIWGDALGLIYFARNTGIDSNPAFGELPAPLTSSSHEINKTNCGVFPHDWESDSDVDLIVGLGSAVGKFLLYRNTGTSSSPNFSAYWIMQYSAGLIYSFNNWHSRAWVSDYNNDGLYDFIASGGDVSAGYKYYKNTGSNRMPYLEYVDQIKMSGVNINVGRYSVARIADWNNDGKNDMISGCDTGNILLFINTGDNSAPAYNQCLLFCDSSGIIDTESMSAPWVYDWNGDGRKDILLGCNTGDVYIYLNSGVSDTLLYFAGNLKDAGDSNIKYGSNATPTFIDYDYDSKEDLILSAGGYIYLFLNKEPNSKVDALSSTQSSLSFTVSWSGSAYNGVKSYDVQYKDGENGTWTDWLTNTTSVSGTFTGQNNHTYYFRCRVKDNSDNYESYPVLHDANTTVSVDYDKTKITNLSAVTGISEGEVLLTWTAPMNPVNVSIPVSSYQIKYSKSAITEPDFESPSDIPVNPPTPLAYGEKQTLSVTGLNPGELYYFALRAVDTLNNDLSVSNIAYARAYTKQIIFVSITPNNPNSVTISNPYDTGTSIEVLPYSVDKEVVISLTKKSASDLTPEQVSSAKTHIDIKNANPYAVYDVVVYDTAGIQITDFKLLKPAKFEILYNQPEVTLDEHYLSAFKWKTGPWTKEGGIRNTDKNTVAFYPESFSRFAVFIEKEKRNGTYPEFCTPNNDDINDRIFFFFTNSNSKPVGIIIYDIEGRTIRRIENAVSGNTFWDGRDSAGNVSETGVYIYRILSDSVFTGTVYVAR